MKNGSPSRIERSPRVLASLVSAGVAAVCLLAPGDARAAERTGERRTAIHPSIAPPRRAAPAAHTAEGERSASPVVQACVAHHTDAQELRMAGRLLQSRVEMRACAAQACPALIQRDCVGWLDSLETQIPSITVRVTLDGRPRTDGQVFVDGEPRRELMLGKAFELNPGKHQLRCVIPGLAPVEEELITIEGERYRMIEVALSSPEAPPGDPSAPPLELHRPVPLPSYVLGGVALAAAINGGIWAASSVSLRGELADSCAPSCPGRRVDELRRRALITDLSWGVSAASLIGAAAFFVLRPELPVEIDVAWLRGGALGRVRFGSF